MELICSKHIYVKEQSNEWNVHVKWMEVPWFSVCAPVQWMRGTDRQRCVGRKVNAMEKSRTEVFSNETARHHANKQTAVIVKWCVSANNAAVQMNVITLL